MLRLLLDENMRAESLWSAIQTVVEMSPFDIVRVGDEAGPPLGIDDAHLLDWAAAEQRLLVSCDKRTLPSHLRNLLASGRRSPGIVFMTKQLVLSEMVEYLQLIATTTSADEWADTYRFIP